MVALAAALAVLWMTRSGLPVSVSTAIVGGIIGWNLFTGSRTDVATLAKIVTTWVVSPILAAAFAAGLYLLVRRVPERLNIHILELDAATRLGLVVAGAVGAYALGANNIANVVGVFVPAVPETSLELFGVFTVTSARQLFLVGGIAIAVGVATYSHRVMMTVGEGLYKLTPVTAFVVVIAEALVLFIFASEGLESWLVARNLPPIPLVPVSSSQAVIGAVLGIAFVKKRGRGVRMPVLGRIVAGWIVTPIIAAVISFLGLFFLQNVFAVEVHRTASSQVSPDVSVRLACEGGGLDAPHVPDDNGGE
jgi:PiT family inorganic phosphate transporter